MPDIILTEAMQKRFQHTLKKISTAYRLLKDEIDELHDDLFVNGKEPEEEDNDT